MGVLVVGGGISGLAAARALAGDGVPVTLVEAAPRLGGKVATERVDGLVIERGPDSFLATRPAAVLLARELGLADQLVGTRDPRAVFIRHRGRLVPMPEGLGLVLPTRAMPFARTRLFSLPEKLRMAKDVVWPRILRPDDVAVGTFLRERLGSPLVERLAGPLVGGVYGTPVDELSLDAVVPTLRTAEREHRSLLFAGL
ncbi:MAG TPA: protoporphyrinogen oxidase, partial [Candidatus Limnocylindrales bacterium]|nr:protoporphyrinogen oxidase [Candidatus Limnocylindrales bacterium]